MREKRQLLLILMEEFYCPQPGIESLIFKLALIILIYIDPGYIHICALDTFSALPCVTYMTKALQ